mmetsp:Transcript_136335/g.339972  ORF Transcript_136335/g.339972 Transcript_136335/m.339972 type:complete len:85 (-) Transcript_136335:175-429(-)
MRPTRRAALRMVTTATASTKQTSRRGSRMSLPQHGYRSLCAKAGFETGSMEVDRLAKTTKRSPAFGYNSQQFVLKRADKVHDFV